MQFNAQQLLFEAFFYTMHIFGLIYNYINIVVYIWPFLLLHVWTHIQFLLCLKHGFTTTPTDHESYSSRFSINISAAYCRKYFLNFNHSFNKLLSWLNIFLRTSYRKFWKTRIIMGRAYFTKIIGDGQKF